MLFSELGLAKDTAEALKEHGFQRPTPVQTKVIPRVLEGNDVVAMAQTGSGKTAAFVLPILKLWHERLGEGKRKLKVLVLAPTRELALQIAEVFRELGYLMPTVPRVVGAIGGEPIGEQLYDIQQGCDVLVATSGRFLDILQKDQMNLSRLEFLVLDEADKMMNADFAEELDLILDAIPQERQNLLFSATYPEKTKELAARITSDPIEVRIDAEEPTVASIEQRVIEVDAANRGPLLRQLLKENKWSLVLVFVASKRASTNLAEKFRKHGFRASAFNGNLEQDLRTDTLEAFKHQEFNILFATDIAARGLDVEDIDCVINFDLPRSPADYIHRIGRTGRAGKSGLAISFIDYESMDHFRTIEKRARVRLKRESVAGFELSGERPEKKKGPAPTKGKRPSKKDKLRAKQRLDKEMIES